MTDSPDRRWSDAELSRFYELYLQGQLDVQIAAAMPYRSATAVMKLRHRLDLPVVIASKRSKDQRISKTLWTDALDAKIMEMSRTGASYADMERDCGIDANRIRRRLERLILEGRFVRAMPPKQQVATGRPALNSERTPMSGFALPAGHPCTWGAISREPFPRKDHG